jgi:1-acyl-sn-glycerol-3-phosphate acyltransferase|tara:strand:+ start:7973 stop:8770 length:798 start_codon:yes stop_codon:yes gene_type:complete
MADRTITKGFIDPTFQVRNLLQRLLGLLYHSYYYILMFVSIIGLFPWLFHYSKHDKDFPSFYRFGRLWSALILNGMGLVRKVAYEADIPWDRPYVVVANHSSELDIMVTYRLVKSPTVFIGKIELTRIPLFGFFFKRSSICVDRKSLASAREVMAQSSDCLTKGLNMCIYPEGGIPKNPAMLLGPFKRGAFKLAIEHGADILPITFGGHRQHFPDLLKGGKPGVIRATVHKPIATKGMTQGDAQALSNSVHDVILSQLKTYRKLS